MNLLVISICNIPDSVQILELLNAGNRKYGDGKLNEESSKSLLTGDEEAESYHFAKNLKFARRVLKMFNAYRSETFHFFGKP